MKRLILYGQLLLLMFSSLLVQAQTNAVCNNFLWNLPPDPTDSVIVVKVAITRIRPSTGTGVWDHVTANHVNMLIKLANLRFSAVTPPLVTVPGIPFVSDAKIRLVLESGNSFYDIVDDSAYKTPQYAYNYYKINNAVNLFLYHVPSGENKSTDSVPGHLIKFAASVPGTDLASWENALAHEIGHYFGLTHATIAGPTSTDDGWPNIQFKFGPNCACDKAAATDFVEWPETSGYRTCTDSIPPPNNLMSQNAGCFSYISPLQMAIMRYHLFTSYKNQITNASYLAVTEVNHNRDIIISNTGLTVWNTPKYIPGNITLAAGSTLKIQCLVAMTHNAKIIVEPGAKLIVDGGTITNFSGRLWAGIEVKGNPTMPQVPANQGVFEMYTGTISNAYSAVHNYGCNANGTINYLTVGGIVKATYGTFLNNVRDVELMPSMKYSSVSKLEACELRTDAAIKDGNLLIQPDAHVYLWGVGGVKIRGCKFENAAQTLYPYKGEGIHSIDAVFTVDDWYNVHNQFIGFSKGINAVNTNPLRTANIYDATFYNNKQGIVIANMESANIDNNQFTMMAQNSMGLSLNNSKYYRVSNNNFTGISNSNTWKAGAYVSSSGNGAHRIYRNNFSNLYLGIAPQFDNSGVNNTADGLMMNCNDFTGGPNGYDIAMMGNNSTAPHLMPTVAKTQGVFIVSKPELLVRNQYGAACTTNGMKKWYIDLSATKGIYHAANSQAVTRPVPQPNCSSNLLNIINSGISLSYNNHCVASGNRPATVPDCPCAKCCLYDEISSGLSLSLNQVATLQNNFANLIDAGNTTGLLANMNGPMTVTQKKNLLLAASPYVSDNVLIAFVQLSAVQGADVIQVHNLNKPVSQAVWSAIVAKHLSASDMATLNELQNSTQISQREILQGELNIAKANLQSIYAEKLNYFLSDTLEHAQDTVIKLLSENLGGLPDAKIQLINAYANAGKYSNAFAKVTELSSNPEYTELMILYRTLLVLDTSRNKLRRALEDNTLKQVLDTYANDSTKAGSSLARAALNSINGRSMNYQYLLPAENISSARIIGQLTEEEQPAEMQQISEEVLNDRFTMYPNPAQNTLMLSYALPVSLESASELVLDYSLKDVLGKEMVVGKIKNNTVVEVNTSALKNGIYFVSLIQDGNVIKNEKIVIMR